MKERPIIFNTEMVQAVLAGRKTQTRRALKTQPSEGWGPDHYCELHKLVNGEPDINKPIGWGVCSDDGYEGYVCKCGKPGDLLWVREAFAAIDYGLCMKYAFKADHSLIYDDFKWKSSIFMPKEASRIWLRVTDVRVERVQDISTQDIKAEGVTIPFNYRPLIPLNDKHFPHEYLSEFITNDLQLGEDELFRAFWIRLWDSINADRGYSWESNPWVWVVSFEVISTEGKP